MSYIGVAETMTFSVSADMTFSSHFGWSFSFTLNVGTTSADWFIPFTLTSTSFVSEKL